MNCPNCNYALSEFDQECPRCAKYPPANHHASPPPTPKPPSYPPNAYPSPAPATPSLTRDDDTAGALFGYGIFSALIPCAGFIVSIISLLNQRPRRGAACLIGTVLGFCGGLTLVISDPQNYMVPVALTPNTFDASGQGQFSPSTTNKPFSLAPSQGLTPEESAYLTKLAQWQTSLKAAIDAVPQSGDAGLQIANLKATIDQILAERWKVPPPSSLAGAHSLTGQGLYKMQSALIMMSMKDTSADFNAATKIFDSGTENARAVAKSRGVEW